ncbi:phage terminase large subunit [Skermanella sp. TT6]|uniref:Phage terminase large subunit n=1 Tax=Skermanella cutis TaxID=2775420 RepID=A0ABX7B638_9PROT|nr:phage terminase large subunit [Skermanella sp. TT6]QQP88576.1 phage terminase large subunit [Skermanella sp. TT6]
MERFESFRDFLIVWNTFQDLPSPDHHMRIAEWLTTGWYGGDRRLLLMAFRNSGKSTVVGLFAAWLLKTDPSLRIMVLAADLALAKKMVRTVKRIVERHPQTQGLKPDRADQWASDQFTVRRPMELRDPSMLARGIGANLTGSRADVVICDDVEVPRTCDTAPKREDLRERLSEIDYILVPGGMQLYVGTPHSYYTIYADEPRAEIGEAVPFLDGFQRLLIPIRDAEGRSAWPTRFPDAAIERIRRATGPNKFESQMMLKPVSIADGRLDPDRLLPYEAELDYREARGVPVLMLGDRRMVSASCWWDPAYGAPEGAAREGRAGDGSVLAAVFSDVDGGYWLHRIRYLTAVPDGDDHEAAQQCRQVAEFLRDLHLPSVMLETNGVGKFLPGILRRELARCGVGASVVEKTSSVPKDRRILEAFDAVLAAGALHAHRSVWDTPFVREMREWRPGGRHKGHDDGLDAVAGCLSNEPVRFGSVGRPGRSADWRGGPPGRAVTDFKV